MALLHDLIPLAAQAGLFLLALAMGLDCGIDDALYVLRRPRLGLGLLLRALPALLAMPLREMPAIRCSGRKAHAYGLLVAAGVLALFTVPLVVAGEVIVLAFVPLAAGMANRVVAPEAAMRALPAIGRCAGLALFLAVAALSLPACARPANGRHPDHGLIAPGREPASPPAAIRRGGCGSPWPSTR
jgi:predicted Na+-dependent transporter